MEAYRDTFEVTRWRQKSIPLQVCLSSLLSLVLLTFLSLRSRREVALFFQSRDRISPASSHDYPEYKTPSKQYENGPMTYF